MKVKIALVALAVMILAISAAAATTTTGTLVVSGTINPSITLAFTLSGCTGGATLGGTTSAATLALGTFPGSLSTNVTAGTYASGNTLTTNVCLTITTANTGNGTYSVTGGISGTSDGNNYLLNSVTLTTGGASVVSNAGAYGANSISWPLVVQLPYSNKTTNISQTITLTATGN